MKDDPSAAEAKSKLEGAKYILQALENRHGTEEEKDYWQDQARRRELELDQTKPTQYRLKAALDRLQNAERKRDRLYETAELDTKLLQMGSDLEMASDSVDEIKAEVHTLQSECMNVEPEIAVDNGDITIKTVADLTILASKGKTLKVISKIEAMDSATENVTKWPHPF